MTQCLCSSSHVRRHRTQDTGWWRLSGWFPPSTNSECFSWQQLPTMKSIGSSSLFERVLDDDRCLVTLMRLDKSLCSLTTIDINDEQETCWFVSFSNLSLALPVLHSVSWLDIRSKQPQNPSIHVRILSLVSAVMHGTRTSTVAFYSIIERFDSCMISHVDDMPVGLVSFPIDCHHMETHERHRPIPSTHTSIDNHRVVFSSSKSSVSFRE
jgi:hypothetical protein